ncbi:MAG TPA: metallopeptidase family protein [Longimicrobiaceae bacterium]|nr:metallopeptidase family protein [Longimicrobiaceae bacterium]
MPSCRSFASLRTTGEFGRRPSLVYGLLPVMTFEQFSGAAHDVFDGIPAHFKEGVDGLEVSRRTVPHPELPEIYTLGECLSEFYPSDYGGPGEVRSRVVLYYGSFLQLSRSHDEWDWDEEIFETITHEIRHHLEHLALEDELEEMDYAEDQNFARREGRSFDPFFFHSGRPVGEGIYEVDGDVFVERRAPKRGAGGGAAVEFTLGERSLRVRVPAADGDILYLRLEPTAGGLVEEQELYLVLVRRRGLIDLARDFLGLQRPTVVEAEADAEVV